MSPKPCAGEGFVAAFGRVDGYDLSQHLRPGAMLRADEIAIAHERQRVALNGIDTMQDVMLLLDLCKDYVADLQVGWFDERDVVHATLDERAHARTGRRELHLSALIDQTYDLGDEYLVR